MNSGPNGLRPVSWWAELLATSERFDAAAFVEGLAGALAPRIGNPLLRREVELAVATVNRHLLRPTNDEFADDADAGRQRLASTLARVDPETTGMAEAEALRRAVAGDYPGAAAAAEPLLGATAVLHLVVSTLRLERFDAPLAVALLNAGRSPAEAVRAGELLGRYQWWPRWLLEIGTARAVAGTLDDRLVAALDRCAYASLTPAQAHVARQLLGGDPAARSAVADRLVGLGEEEAADALRRGDPGPVALAAKLTSY